MNTLVQIFDIITGAIDNDGSYFIDDRYLLSKIYACTYIHSFILKVFGNEGRNTSGLTTRH